jgi:ELWxxDGT repeat protein
MFEFLSNNQRSRRRGFRQFRDMESLEVRLLLSAVVPGLTIDGQVSIVLPEVNGQELLAVSDGVATTKFYSTDGTAAGTVQFAELPVVIDQPLQEYAVSNGELFFAATDPSLIGNELWKTDGTAAGTTLVKDINQQTSLLPSRRDRRSTGRTLGESKCVERFRLSIESRFRKGYHNAVAGGSMSFRGDWIR